VTSVGTLIGAGVLALILLTAGCGGSDEGTASTPVSSLASVSFAAASDSLYPYATLSDWVSYADQVSIVVVVDEGQEPVPAEIEVRGVGSVGREVAFLIEETIWSRPGAPSIEGKVSYWGLGYAMHDGELVPYRGADPIEVGERFLVPLLAIGGEGSLRGWGPLSPAAAHPVREGGLVVAPGDGTAPPNSEASGALVGLTVAEVADVLAATKPDPLAVEFAALPPYDRVLAVEKARMERG
jgi:hypothetical protein